MFTLGFYYSLENRQICLEETAIHDDDMTSYYVELDHPKYFVVVEGAGYL